jgi:hypothetical protein
MASRRLTEFVYIYIYMYGEQNLCCLYDINMVRMINLGGIGGFWFGLTCTETAPCSTLAVWRDAQKGKRCIFSFGLTRECVDEIAPRTDHIYMHRPVYRAPTEPHAAIFWSITDQVHV